MLTWLRTAHGVVAVVATILAVVATWWQLGVPRVVFARIDAEAFNRDSRSWCSTRPWWSANPLGMLWPEMDAAFLGGDKGSGEPPAGPQRPVVVVAAG